MATIHFDQKTRLTPEQFIAGLTDFGPRRSTVLRSSADDYPKVHLVGPAEADVTEGSGGVWERLHYDWPTATGSFQPPPIRTCGAAPRATPTRSDVRPTARPT